jgi:hypothetical protein
MNAHQFVCAKGIRTKAATAKQKKGKPMDRLAPCFGLELF